MRLQPLLMCGQPFPTLRLQFQTPFDHEDGYNILSTFHFLPPRYCRQMFHLALPLVVALARAVVLGLRQEGLPGARAPSLGVRRGSVRRRGARLVPLVSWLEHRLPTRLLLRPLRRSHPQPQGPLGYSAQTGVPTTRKCQPRETSATNAHSMSNRCPNALLSQLRPRGYRPTPRRRQPNTQTW